MNKSVKINGASKRASQSNILNLPILSTLLLILFSVALSACGGDPIGNTSNNMDTDNDGVADINDAFPLDNSRSAFIVGNLRAIPDVASITLTWDNAASISMINISYIATSGGANRVTQTLTTYQGASIIGNNQTAASAAISSLTDGTEYNFTVTPILGGADAVKNTAGVSVIRTIGANFDNDDEPDSIDADDDGDGVVDIDTDDDGTGDNADKDDDSDGVNDINDAFPLDNSRSAFRVGNLRAIPDVMSITLTWDNPAANISMINISYIATSGGANRVTQTLTIYHGASIIGNNQTAASAVISALTDGTEYNFTVTPILGGADAAKKTAGVSAIRTIGANFDNDDEPDSIDEDDDNDGANDINDAFPLDNSRSAFRVGNLRAIPGVTNITLTWDNPAASISMINISYIATSGGANRVTQTLTIYHGASIIGNNQTAASAVISALTDGTEYNFTVTPILGGADAAKKTAGVSAIRTIGANFDNDDEPDSIDEDDDNDGANDGDDAFPKDSTETTDTDDDGTGDNADKDDDSDGVNDINDAFPLDNSSSAFRVGNLRAIPDVMSITLTWDNPAASISMINISYIATSGGVNRVTQTLTTYQGASIIGNNQTAASAVISALTDGTEYNFTVTPILGGADAAKNTAGVSVIRTIGANFDNDDEPDGIDADDDNDGVNDDDDDFPNDSTETTDTDGDGTGDNEDAFPMDNSSSAFRVGNLRAIPDVMSITLTWDNPAASISMINISYIATSGGANRVTQTLTTYQGASIIGNNQTAASAVISALTDGTEYNFTVTPILGGADAAKNTAGVSAIRTIGANFDNDDEPDSIDADDDNDGVNDDIDAFPKDSTETIDTDGDGTGDNADTNDDDDDHLDIVDVDDDGDGLIEIHNATQLDQVRHNLAGDSFKATMDATGSATGCGGLNGITTCSGYELAAPIDLSTIDNWQPLGFCTSNECADVDANPFTGTFDGNGHIISGLAINSTDNGRFAIALFGIIEGAELRNIHLRGASVNVNHAARTAMLVGLMSSGSTLSKSSAQGLVTSTTTSDVGGLVGGTINKNVISSSYVFDSVLSSEGTVGGLVGYFENSDVRFSYVFNTAVSGINRVGGLVGYFQNADISASYVSNTAVSGDDNTGGLIGVALVIADSKVTASYVLATSVNGSNYVGGLVGRSAFINPQTLTIDSTYVAQVELHSTGSNIGGLAGEANTQLRTPASYWQGMIFINGVQDNSASVAGTEKTPSELQSSAFTGNYADWGGFWCDADSGEFTDYSTSPLATDENSAWVLPPLAVSASFPAAPHISRYPTLRCTPGGAAAQYTQRLGL